MLVRFKHSTFEPFNWF